jgi:hypothetical protein
MAMRLSALSTCCSFHRRKCVVLISVRDWVNSSAMMPLEGLGKLTVSQWSLGDSNPWPSGSWHTSIIYATASATAPHCLRYEPMNQSSIHASHPQYMSTDQITFRHVSTDHTALITRRASSTQISGLKNLLCFHSFRGHLHRGRNFKFRKPYWCVGGQVFCSFHVSRLHSPFHTISSECSIPIRISIHIACFLSACLQAHIADISNDYVILYVLGKCMCILHMNFSPNLEYIFFLFPYFSSFSWMLFILTCKFTKERRAEFHAEFQKPIEAPSCQTCRFSPEPWRWLDLKRTRHV